MYSISNEDVEKKYINSDALPSDEEYGRYIMCEIEALGFSVKRFKINGKYDYIFIISLLNDKVKAAFLCKSNPKGIVSIPNDSFRSLCSVKGASLYGVITNNSLLGDKSRMLRSKGYFPYGGFKIGNSVLNILISAGIVTTALGDFLIHKGISDAGMAFDESFNDIIIESDVAEEEEKSKMSRDTNPDMLARYKSGKCDEKINDALKAMCSRSVISAGSLSRILSVSMNRSNKILHELECLGVVSKSDNGKPRNVLLTSGMIEKRFGITLYDDDVDWDMDYFGVTI